MPKFNPEDNNLYSRSSFKDFNTTYIPLNIFLNTARTIIFTRFMVRGLDTDDFPFLTLRNVPKY